MPYQSSVIFPRPAASGYRKRQSLADHTRLSAVSEPSDRLEQKLLIACDSPRLTDRHFAYGNFDYQHNQ
jgi:hypothetical protein